MRTFCIAGPVNEEKHYYIPHRLNEAQLRQLIEENKYYILHAPRQSGKTTAILHFVDLLNSEKKYKVLYINAEPMEAVRGNVKDGMEVLLTELAEWADDILGSEDPLIRCVSDGLQNVSASSFKQVLRAWSIASDRPTILFIDEIDSIVGDTLIAVLRQLRAGYTKRPKSFSQSVCLVGVRDVRDYRIWSEQAQAIVLGGSAFNIKAESLTINNFTLEQVHNLYEQHTQETGQQFTDEAITLAYTLTSGQPWLVNALAFEACFRDVIDRSQPITKDIIERAKDELIARRDTHIDQLVDKLAEPRVRAIIDAIIVGSDEPENFPIDDISYVLDLGLVSKINQHLKISNPIYQEIIPRELSYGTQISLTQQLIWYQNKDGSLDMNKILVAFVQFYRENSEIWREKFAYRESAPHLLLMAFLQRIINGGGRVGREYALGSRRVDISIEWPAVHAKQRIVLELKIKRERDKNIIAEGLEQTADYMDKFNATEGHLLIFDEAVNKTWDEKIFVQSHTVGKNTITVWGM